MNNYFAMMSRMKYIDRWGADAQYPGRELK